MLLLLSCQQKLVIGYMLIYIFWLRIKIISMLNVVIFWRCHYEGEYFTHAMFKVMNSGENRQRMWWLANPHYLWNFIQFYTIVVLEKLYFRLKLNIFQVVRVKKKSYDSSIWFWMLTGIDKRSTEYRHLTARSVKLQTLQMNQYILTSCVANGSLLWNASICQPKWLELMIR